MSDMKPKKNMNGDSDTGASAKANGHKKPDAAHGASSKTKANDDLDMINALAADANPHQIKTWIGRLEHLYEVKRSAIRTELKSQLDDLLHSNDYTIEELYAARLIPSTSELAAQAKKRKSSPRSKREQSINSISSS